jgi:hypothetical protein
MPKTSGKSYNINEVRRLPKIEAFIEEFHKKWAFGRIWNRVRGTPLNGSHITLVDDKEMVSIFGIEPFGMLHYHAHGSRSFALLRKVKLILDEYGVEIQNPIL